MPIKKKKTVRKSPPKKRIRRANKTPFIRQKVKSRFPAIDLLLEKNNQGIKVDLGCGAMKQPGFVGVDNRPLPGVDIVHDLELFPWPLPDACASLVMTSHLLEHLDPHAPDARIAPLINLLMKKGVITREEVEKTIGEVEPGPLFIRFMDEVWRILKPGGLFMSSFPYAGSSGFFQDPTHLNQINAATMTYFDPIAGQGVLYNIYKPKPWAIKECTYAVNGNMEVLLEKRKIDPSYL